MMEKWGFWGPFGDVPGLAADATGLGLGAAGGTAAMGLPLYAVGGPAAALYHGLRRPKQPIDMPEITREDEFGEQAPANISSAAELSKVLSSPGMRESLSALTPEEIERGTCAQIGPSGPMGLRRFGDYLSGRRLFGGGSVGKFLKELGGRIEGSGSLENKLMRLMPDAKRDTLYTDVANLLTRAGHGTSSDVAEALGQSSELGGMELKRPGLLKRMGPLAALATGVGGGALLSHLMRGRGAQ